MFQTVSELVEIARVPSAKQPLVLGDGARVQSTVNEKRVDATHWNRSLLGPRRASPPFQEEAQKAAAVEKELVTGTAQLHAVIDGLEALGTWQTTVLCCIIYFKYIPLWLFGLPLDIP